MSQLNASAEKSRNQEKWERLGEWAMTKGAWTIAKYLTGGEPRYILWRNKEPLMPVCMSFKEATERAEKEDERNPSS